jgi:hypothetical protein
VGFAIVLCEIYGDLGLRSGERYDGARLSVMGSSLF